MRGGDHRDASAVHSEQLLMVETEEYARQGMAEGVFTMASW